MTKFEKALIQLGLIMSIGLSLLAFILICIHVSCKLLVILAACVVSVSVASCTQLLIDKIDNISNK